MLPVVARAQAEDAGEDREAAREMGTAEGGGGRREEEKVADVDEGGVIRGENQEASVKGLWWMI